jgi:hypothetical protein
LPCAARYENITPQALVEKLSASVPWLSIVVAKQFGSEGNSFVIGLLFQSISIYSAQKEIRGGFAGASITIKFFKGIGSLFSYFTQLLLNPILGL